MLESFVKNHRYIYIIIIRPPDKAGFEDNLEGLYFSTKTYVVTPH